MLNSELVLAGWSVPFHPDSPSSLLFSLSQSSREVLFLLMADLVHKVPAEFNCCRKKHAHIFVWVECHKVSSYFRVLLIKSGPSHCVCVRPSVRQSIKAIPACTISLKHLEGFYFFKFITNIHLDSRMSRLDFRGHRSKVKVTNLCGSINPVTYPANTKVLPPYLFTHDCKMCSLSVTHQ